MCVHMMATVRTDAALGLRLERLTGGDPSCCVSGYSDLATKVREAPLFSRRLLAARAMADESRLVILGLLRRDRELCACELQAAIGVTHATVSHHMHVLQEAGLVGSERRGKWVYYHLAEDGRAEAP